MAEWMVNTRTVLNNGFKILILQNTILPISTKKKKSLKGGFRPVFPICTEKKKKRVLAKPDASIYGILKDQS